MVPTWAIWPSFVPTSRLKDPVVVRGELERTIPLDVPAVSELTVPPSPAWLQSARGVPYKTKKSAFILSATSRLTVGATRPIPTLPFPRMVIFVVLATSLVPPEAE